MAKSKEGNTQEFTEVSPAQATTYLEHCMKVRRPVFLWGSPGIGKSEIIEQIAKRQNRLVIDMRLILMGPEDLKGIPYFDANEGTLRWAPSSELPEVMTQAEVDSVQATVDLYQETLESIYAERTDYEAAKAAAEEAGEEFTEKFDMLAYASRVDEAKAKLEKATGKLNRYKGSLAFQDAILFLDEMNSAPPAVQGAAYQLTLNRKVGEYELPDGVSIVAAGNKDTDKGVTYRMPTPLANRFIHLYMDVKFDDWKEWAIADGVHADVVGYLMANKHNLHKFDPKLADKAFATPRSWVFVSDLLQEQMEFEMARTLIGGTIGEGLAVDFMAHRKIIGQMPEAIDILEGRVKTLSDKFEVSAQYSLTISLCHEMKDIREKLSSADHPDVDEKYYIDCYDNYLEFLMDVMQEEMVILGATTALKTYKLPLDRNKSRKFGEMFEKYGKMVLNT